MNYLRNFFLMKHITEVIFLKQMYSKFFYHQIMLLIWKWYFLPMYSFRSVFKVQCHIDHVGRSVTTLCSLSSALWLHRIPLLDALSIKTLYDSFPRWSYTCCEAATSLSKIRCVSQIETYKYLQINMHLQLRKDGYTRNIPTYLKV